MVVKDNMGRIFTISLLLNYLIFSAGVVIGNHICGGQFKDVSFFKHPKDCCPDANSEKSCCINSISVLKVEDNYDNNFKQAGGFKSPFPHIIHETSVSLIYLKDLQDKSRFNPEWYSDHRLRDKPNLPIYLANRVFII